LSLFDNTDLVAQIDFGISALAGIAEATVFLALKASATTTLTLQGSVQVPVAQQQQAQAQARVNGCLDIVGGLSIDAGANAQFFNLFDPSVSVNLFNKEFQFFKVRLIAVS
jgi:hypothetical protein